MAKLTKSAKAKALQEKPSGMVQGRSPERKRDRSPAREPCMPSEEGQDRLPAMDKPRGRLPPPVSLYNPRGLPPLPGNSRESPLSLGGSGSNPQTRSQTPQSNVSWRSHGGDSNLSFVSSLLQEEAKLRWDPEEELKRVSKDLLRLQKWGLIVGLVLLNGGLIYVSLRFWQVYYLSMVLLSANTALQAMMIICIAAHFLVDRTVLRLWRRRRRRRRGDVAEEKASPERMVLLLPCYNENLDELRRSLDSLVDQEGIDRHPRVIFIVVDGDARGPGMEKTTQAYLLEDVLGPGPGRRFDNGYRARDGLLMPVRTQTGLYRGLPYIFVGKQHNQGKRDSLCFARSFLYHFQRRSEGVVTMFSGELFEHLALKLAQHGVDSVDYLVGMDADTVFDRRCVAEMMRAIRRSPELVGVCGHVCVDFGSRPFGLWSLYQSVEYSQTQGLRRTFQSLITGKVNCLPGCCQMIRVDEATFGDAVLRDRFGYCPKPNDVLTRQVLGNYSEDSIHASIVFSLFPRKRTTQALRAKAFTVVPQNWAVFLSQRKRWCLGSISNEFVMIFRPGIILVERLQSIVTVATWALTPFVISAVAELLVLVVRRGRHLLTDRVFVGLICVLLARYVYSFCIGIWLPRTRLERVQYFVGFFFHFVTSPFMNIIVVVYSLLHSDDFKWGKTREVVASPEEKSAGGGRGGH